ncbi:Catalyzes the reduction of fatty acyl-CoA to fatty alcohol [Asimina triloba]
MQLMQMCVINISEFGLQVMENELFRILREKHSEDFDSFITEKVTAVAVDIFYQNLGITDSGVVEEMWKEVNIVEAYSNSIGACVSAYAAGEKSGLIMEEELRMGETMNGNSTLDVDIEMNLVNEKMKELSDLGATEREITSAMKEMGTVRYETLQPCKALGEMLLGQYRDHVPLVILRPTIVTSTYKEPFPGWIQGVSYITDEIVDAFLPHVIPGDMVVNEMVAAVVAHSNQQSQIFIDHLQAYIIDSRDSFHRHTTLRYKLPLKALGLANATCCGLFQKLDADSNGKFNYFMRLIQVYEPFVPFKGRSSHVPSLPLLKEKLPCVLILSPHRVSGSVPCVQPRMSGMTLARTHRVQCAHQASHRCVASCSLTVPLDASHQ